MGTSSSSSSSDDSEVADSSVPEISSSLSLDVSEQVEGSYSCLRGDDDRRLFLKPGTVGVSTGVLDPVKVTGVVGVFERCGGGGGGSSLAFVMFKSSAIVSPTSWEVEGADVGDTEDVFRSSAVTRVEGPLDLRSLGIVGMSSVGTEDARRCTTGRTEGSWSLSTERSERSSSDSSE